MRISTVAAFFAGFFVGPVYFNHVYPWLYHLILPK